MEVGQFIYMRLEKSESPRGVSGFQTVFFTQRLISEMLMQEIESHLRFDSTNEERQLIFRTVGDQQLVLVQLQSIPMVDNCGRGGNFVAHGLVLSHDQFLSVGGNPIGLAQSTRFVATGEDARRQGDVSTGEMDAYKIVTDSIAQPSGIVEGARWTGTELRNLLVLSIHLADPHVQQRAAAIHGSPERILETLQLVFDLLPWAMRPSLSFETQSPRLERGGACLQGFRTRPPHDGFPEINASECIVDSIEEPVTSFGRWVRQSSVANTAADVGRFNEYCWNLGRLIDWGDSDRIYLRDTDGIADEFWRLNLDAARRRLLQVYTQRIGYALAQRALRHLLLRHRPVELLEQIAVGGKDAAVARSLHLAYCESAEPAGRDERRQLGEFLRRFDDDSLTMWLAFWTGDWPRLRQRLQKPPRGELSRFVAHISELNYIDISRFMISGREMEVVAGLLLEFDVVNRRHLANPVGPNPFTTVSEERLAKLNRLISTNPELFTGNAEQADGEENRQRGITQLPRRAPSSWWRLR